MTKSEKIAARREKIAALKEEGFSPIAIADRVGVVPETVYKDLAAMGYARRRYNRATDEDIKVGLMVLAAVNTSGHCFSLRDIAECCGCTHETIRTIEKSALKKLRKNKVLREFL